MLIIPIYAKVSLNAVIKHKAQSRDSPPMRGLCLKELILATQQI
ncbi:hypothetical protein [uncultured Gammaproteobacteria bacterium]|nr:hypothetical protein [uncultured Gammaproteobacteria bacterium]